jgi:hypothetical protein
MIMTSKQKWIIGLGGALLLALVLFPPWQFEDNNSRVRFAGYRFILTPPTPPDPALLFPAPLPLNIQVQIQPLVYTYQIFTTLCVLSGLLLFFTRSGKLITRLFGAVVVLLPFMLVLLALAFMSIGF